MDLLTYFVVKTAVKAIVQAATDSECADAPDCPEPREKPEVKSDSGDDLIGIILDSLT